MLRGEIRWRDSVNVLEVECIDMARRASEEHSMVPSESVSAGISLSASKEPPRAVNESRNMQRLAWS